MTLLDYDSKESKQGRLYNTRTEQLYGYSGNNRNNRSAFLQTGVRSTSVDIKKTEKKTLETETSPYSIGYSL
ncbi:hypothetical protein MF1_01380 [Bartonella quintana]|nr:hypothetical protein MF1_01380 [Bartonella quintana]